jgi:hypothetical protein
VAALPGLAMLLWLMRKGLDPSPDRRARSETID